MKKFIFTFLLLVAGVFNVYSQEAYVGLQYQRSNPDIRHTNFRFDDKTDTLGVNVSYTNYVTKNLGVTGEVTANFNDKANSSQLYTLLGGLTFKSKSRKVQPFVRALGGIAVQRAHDEASANVRRDEGFAYSLGGGVDYKFNKFSLRVIQADLLRTNVFNKDVNYVRIGTGIVF